MRLLLKFFSLIIWVNLCATIGNGQEYLWPTDASRYLTSAFAEYRPGHFHAGIDIKTWGQIGYKVFAIRDGYIVRIGVSPFGYGKVIYQKLYTGETIVYAHLDRFNDALQKFIKQQQKQKRAYRLNEYLAPEQFPVKQGELIGYTGASGIGNPHLHFETRDKNNNPINPFLLGYKIADSVPPVVAAISLTPLDHASQVNSDVIPFIEKPERDGKGNYRLKSSPLVSGNIGFAVDCYDQADGVENTFAVYKINFYVDSTLQFSATYNKFSYDESQFIDFDRDYRLIARGIGIFQKLYKEEINQLRFYLPAGKEIGVLRCDPSLSDEQLAPDRIGVGRHQFSLQLIDFFDNVTSVTGNFFVVGKKIAIRANFRVGDRNQIYVSNLVDENENVINEPEFFVSSDDGKSWRNLVPISIESKPDSNRMPINEFLLETVKPGAFIKIQSPETNPAFHFISDSSVMLHDATPELILEKDFYDDFMRLKVTVKGVIQEMPQLFIQQIGMPPTSTPLWQSNVNEFIGVYQLAPGKDGPLSVEIKADDFRGQELIFWEQFQIKTVFPDRGGMIASEDGRCKLFFDKGAVYKNLFFRMTDQNPLIGSEYDATGNVYEIHPQDIPLKEPGVLELKIPASDTLPEKLGIYRQTKNGWNFVGNKIESSRNLITAPVSNLGAFTLIRDKDSPLAAITAPGKGSIITDKMPALLATVYDKLSGIASERSIVMKLDNQELIAEYDPEARTIKYVPDSPLSSGEHTLSVWAIDNCKNTVSVSHKFMITK